MEFRKHDDYPLGDITAVFTDGEGIMYVSVEPGTGATTQRDGVEVERGPFAVPQPGEVCPLCHEKTPNKHALEMRAWRARRN